MFKRKDAPVLVIEPLDLVWLNIDPTEETGGIVVPRIPETWAEVNKLHEAISTKKCTVVGHIPAKRLLKDTKWADGKIRKL